MILKYAKNMKFNFHVYHRQLLLLYFSFTFTLVFFFLFSFSLMQDSFPPHGPFISKVQLDLLLDFILVSVRLYCIADHFFPTKRVIVGKDGWQNSALLNNCPCHQCLNIKTVGDCWKMLCKTMNMLCISSCQVGNVG